MFIWHRSDYAIQCNFVSWEAILSKEFSGEYTAKNTGNPVYYRYFPGKQLFILITEENLIDRAHTIFVHNY